MKILEEGFPNVFDSSEIQPNQVSKLSLTVGHPNPNLSNLAIEKAKAQKECLRSQVRNVVMFLVMLWLLVTDGLDNLAGNGGVYYITWLELQGF